MSVALAVSIGCAAFGPATAQDWQSLCGSTSPWANGCDLSTRDANTYAPSIIVGMSGPIASTQRSAQVVGSSKGTAFSWNVPSTVRVGPALSSSVASFSSAGAGGSFSNSASLGQHTLSVSASAAASYDPGTLNAGRATYGSSNVNSSAGLADTLQFTIPDASNNPSSPLYKSTATLLVTISGTLAARSSGDAVPAEADGYGQFLAQSFKSMADIGSGPLDYADLLLNRSAVTAGGIANIDVGASSVSKFGDVAFLGSGVYEIDVDLFGTSPILALGGYLGATTGAYRFGGSGPSTGTASGNLYASWSLLSVSRPYDMVTLSEQIAAPVPEPAEWMTMIAGLAIVGAAARRLNWKPGDAAMIRTVRAGTANR